MVCDSLIHIVTIVNKFIAFLFAARSIFPGISPTHNTILEKPNLLLQPLLMSRHFDDLLGFVGKFSQ